MPEPDQGAAESRRDHYRALYFGLSETLDFAAVDIVGFHGMIRSSMPSEAEAARLELSSLKEMVALETFAAEEVAGIVANDFVAAIAVVIVAAAAFGAADDQKHAARAKGFVVAARVVVAAVQVVVAAADIAAVAAAVTWASARVGMSVASVAAVVAASVSAAGDVATVALVVAAAAIAAASFATSAVRATCAEAGESVDMPANAATAKGFAAGVGRAVAWKPNYRPMTSAGLASFVEADVNGASVTLYY